MMEEVLGVLGLDRVVFREWVSAERSRLPGSSQGFALFLAALRMLRPAEVVWISDDREAEQCGYTSSSVGRLIMDVLPVGSRFVWSSVSDPSGVLVHEFRGIDGVLVGSSFTVVCIPEGYSVELSGGHGSLVVRRAAGDWVFSWESHIGVGSVGFESGSGGGGVLSGDLVVSGFGADSDISANLSTVEDDSGDGSGFIGGHSGDTAVGGTEGDVNGGDEPVDTESKPSRRRGKVRRSGGD